MANNLPRIPIGGEWINLNSVSGLAVGTALKIQHTGGTNVDIAISENEPAATIGEVLIAWQWYAVIIGEANPVWAKTSSRSGGAQLSVQDDT